MHRKIKELLLYPDAFFARKSGEQVSLVIPAAIILIGGMVGLATPLILSLFSGQTQNQTFLTPEMILVALALPFLVWVIISGIFFVMCRLFSGTGTFCATLQNTGYGALPLTIMSVFGIFNGILIARFLEVPHGLAAGAIIALSFLSILCIIWSGYIWTHAMEKTHAIPRKHAMETAFSIVILYLGMILVTLLVTG